MRANFFIGNGHSFFSPFPPHKIRKNACEDGAMKTKKLFALCALCLLPVLLAGCAFLDELKLFRDGEEPAAEEEETVTEEELTVSGAAAAPAERQEEEEARKAEEARQAVIEEKKRKIREAKAKRQAEMQKKAEEEKVHNEVVAEKSKPIVADVFSKSDSAAKSDSSFSDIPLSTAERLKTVTVSRPKQKKRPASRRLIDPRTNKRKPFEFAELKEDQNAFGSEPTSGRTETISDEQEEQNTQETAPKKKIPGSRPPGMGIGVIDFNKVSLKKSGSHKK